MELDWSVDSAWLAWKRDRALPTLRSLSLAVTS
jgi:hypothetical protein